MSDVLDDHPEVLVLDERRSASNLQTFFVNDWK
jgi:hypothetical protein